MAGEQLSIITRKGQVTIPASIRHSLGMKEGDQVAFVMEDGAIRIIPRGRVTERTRGMFKTGRPPLTAEELRAAAEIAIAAEAEERGT